MKYDVLSLGLIAVCFVASPARCPGQDPNAVPTPISTAKPAREQMTRLIATLEIARRHAELWESNPAATTLVKQMMSDLIENADLDLRWTSRFFLEQDENGARGEKGVPDDFEARALAKLRAAPAKQGQVWSGDRRRTVIAIKARQSCVSCHVAEPGVELGYVSLRLSPR